jgi:RNA polymerase sigma factor (sigma-70 family)
MTQGSLGPVLGHIRRLAGARRVRELTDGQLLHRFAAHREETAFAALVERHGRLVMRVCRNVLHHEQDAEDAFQATFIVMARRAGSIQHVQAVGSWLYRVAHRIAKKAGASMARRRIRERKAGNRIVRSAHSEAAWQELQEVLHQELDRLPATYREPFVLCCIEGRPGSEAARLLGWKEGTVSGRLSRARKLLRERLARRGMALPAVLAALALAAPEANATVPLALKSVTLQAALRHAACDGAAGVVSARVAELAQGMSRTMIGVKIKIATAILIAAGAAAFGLRAVTQREASAQTAAQTPKADAPHAAGGAKQEANPAGEETVELTGQVLGPDGKAVRRAAAATQPACAAGPGANLPEGAGGRPTPALRLGCRPWRRPPPLPAPAPVLGQDRPALEP